MAEKSCERCGKRPSGFRLLRYCAYCSTDLCDDCMGQGCCGQVPAINGDEEDDADSDDNFEVDEPTREAAEAKIAAEVTRRAALGAKGYAEPIAYVCEADIRELANKPDGTDISIAPRPFPECGMNFALYAEPQWPNDAVRSALSEMVDYYTATEDAELFQEEARLLENARAALRGNE